MSAMAPATLRYFTCADCRARLLEAGALLVSGSEIMLGQTCDTHPTRLRPAAQHAIDATSEQLAAAAQAALSSGSFAAARAVAPEDVNLVATLAVQIMTSSEAGIGSDDDVRAAVEVARNVLAVIRQER